MKKLICLMLLMVIMIPVISSCAEQKPVTVMFPEPDTSVEPVDLSGEYPAKTMKAHSIIEALYRYSPLGEKEGLALKDYLGGSEKSKVCAEYYKKADSIKIIPVYGPYFQYTSIATALFYSENELIGTVNLVVEEKNGVMTVEDLEPRIKDNDLLMDRLSDSCIFRNLKVGPDATEGHFDLVALEYNGGNVFEVGFDNSIKEPKQLKIRQGGLLESISYIEPSGSIEEIRKSYYDYFVLNSELDEKLPVYEWKPTSRTLFEIYSSQSMISYLDAKGWNFSIPLLDENGKENVYEANLVFQGRKLIAEVILKRVTKDGHDQVEIVRERVSEKDVATGRYEGLKNSEYHDFVSSQKGNGADIKGIGFDGEKFLIVK